MARQPLQTITVPNNFAQLQKAFDDLIDALNFILGQPLANQYVEKLDVSLSTTNTEITHNLGRVPKRIFPLLLSAGVQIYVDTAHPDPFNKMYVKATASCVANLLIS